MCGRIAQRYKRRNPASRAKLLYCQTGFYALFFPERAAQNAPQFVPLRVIETGQRQNRIGAGVKREDNQLLSLAPVVVYIPRALR